jgi:hypothetical protein
MRIKTQAVPCWIIPTDLLHMSSSTHLILSLSRLLLFLWRIYYLNAHSVYITLLGLQLASVFYSQTPIYVLLNLACHQIQICHKIKKVPTLHTSKNVSWTVQPDASAGECLSLFETVSREYTVNWSNIVNYSNNKMWYFWPFMSLLYLAC